jgi:uncharacterized membrane protein YqjE
VNDDRPDSAGEADADQEPAPHLDESVRRVAAAGRETFGAGRDTARAVRRLVGADLALARGAIIRALPWAALALVFAFSTWLMLLAVMVAAFHAMGLGWLATTALSAAISLLATALAGWRVAAYLRHAGLQATRRQLARFGLFQHEEEEGEATSPPARPETSTP